MSKYQFHKAILRKLEVLNRSIDQKILAGKPYAREAEHHRVMRFQLHRLEAEKLRFF